MCVAQLVCCCPCPCPAPPASPAPRYNTDRACVWHTHGGDQGEPGARHSPAGLRAAAVPVWWHVCWWLNQVCACVVYYTARLCRGDECGQGQQLGIEIDMQRQAESFCRKHRQQGGVTAASITYKDGQRLSRHVDVRRQGVVFSALCAARLLPAGLAESTASCGSTAIWPRCGGATARRASAAARVADLTQQSRLQVVHSQPSRGW